MCFATSLLPRSYGMSAGCIWQYSGQCCVNMQVFLTREYLAISMEFAQGGDLFAYTLGPKSYGKLAEAQARWIFQQLILGLDYCHRKVCCLVLSTYSSGVELIAASLL